MLKPNLNFHYQDSRNGIGKNMRKIAIANRKFEVKNIITAVNVAAGLAAADYKFLLVDTDIQGHYSKLLGINPEKDSVENS